MIYEHYTIGGELYHHGILGQKWGDRNGPPYPLGSGDHSAKEKKAGWRQSLSGKIADRKRKKRQAAALEKARAAKVQNAERKKEEADREAKKEKALNSGSASDVMKFQGDLTNEQLQRALNRLNLEGQLSKLSQKDVKTVTDKVDSIITKLDKATKWTQTGINAYNTAAKIINAFSDGDELPTIGERSNRKIKADLNEQKYKDSIKKLTKENNELRNKGVELDNKKKELENEGVKIDNDKKRAELKDAKKDTPKETKKDDSSFSSKDVKNSFDKFKKAAEDEKKVTESILSDIDKKKKKKK